MPISRLRKKKSRQKKSSDNRLKKMADIYAMLDAEEQRLMNNPEAEEK